MFDQIKSDNMKKFLLSCAVAALGAGCAFADQVTFDFTESVYGLENQTVGNTDSNSKFVTDGTAVNCDVSMYIKTAKGSGARVWSDGLRFMKGENSVTVSAKDAVITDLSFTTTGTFGTDAVSVDSGEFVWSSGDKTYTWSGSSTDALKITFTNTATKAMVTMTVTYEAAGDPELKAANIEFAETAFTAILGGEFTAPVPTKDTTAELVYSSSDETVASVDPATGAVTIAAPGETVITATADANAEYNAGSASYRLTVMAAASNIAELMSLANEYGLISFVMNGDVTVAYVNGRYVYVQDAAGDATLYYLTADQAANFTAGDLLKGGYTVTYAEYNTLPEFTIPGDLPVVESQGNTVNVKDITVAEVSADLVNQLVNVAEVTFAEATPAEKGFTGSGLAFYNTFKIASVEAGTYNVKAIVSINNGNVQVLPIEYSVTTGVAEVETAEGVAKYYDLNGREVKGQLVNGLYVKVVDGKASKVLVK